jgi:hypothetical protein
MSDVALELELELEPMTVIGRPRTMGAIELIELGNAHVAPAMISNNPTSKRWPELTGTGAQLGILGDVVNYFFTFVGNGLSSVTNILSQILAVPVNLLGGGIGIVLTSFAGIVGQIPILGEMTAAIILAANSIIQAAIQLPGQILEMIGNLGKAFATLSPDQQKSLTGLAMQTLIKSSPTDIKDQVSNAVETAAPPGISTGTAAEPAFSLLDGLMVLLNGGGVAALAFL